MKLILRRSVLNPASLTLVFSSFLVSCDGTVTPTEESTLGSNASVTDESAINSSTSNPPWFVEVSRSLGITFQHQDGRSGQRFYVETVASGGGWADFDRDGDLDLYLVNGAATPGSTLEGTPHNHLYENTGERFEDISAPAGVADTGYGMGLCIGDVDGDGWDDLMVTNYGPDRLFRNLTGDGKGLRFEDVTERAGVAGDAWGTNCAFADVDGDSDLDLYVANYVDFKYSENPRCGDVTRDAWSYCRPLVFRGQSDFLYINRGDGTFTEQGSLRGLDQQREDRGFGVIASDLDRDGHVDILVANDGTANRLYRNDGLGHFVDVALTSGLALLRNGQAESGMGMALGDVDGDQLEDLIVTNYSFETNTLYLNRGSLFYEDSTERARLAKASFLPVSWGVALTDFDNDGDADLAIANGHVMDTIDLFEDGIGYPQPNALLSNDGSGAFTPVTEAGPDFRVGRVSRALAIGDWNNDGRIDLLVTNTNDQVDVLENRVNNNNHWIGFDLTGGKASPSAIGARVRLTCAGNDLGEREVRSGGSLLAQNDLRLHFGLGECSGPAIASVRWPSGQQQTKRFEAVDQYHQIEASP